MKTKVLEIRDAGTCIPVLCVDMNPTSEVERAYLRRCGYPCNGEPNVLMTHAEGKGDATNDPYAWGDRTRAAAHHHIIDNWATLNDGDVIDVQFIKGETTTPKAGEIWRNA